MVGILAGNIVGTMVGISIEILFDGPFNIGISARYISWGGGRTASVVVKTKISICYNARSIRP